ncbi:MFS transporter [Methylomarinum vadi]|uniref:MFS transporter n=1 Tax=Methylomarinum vadi TaxID=438855 RepID=UPI0004DEF296|nr:MFS transporter [Methylomarinum vadi]
MTVPYWRLSAFYFFYFATLGCFLPYWSLFLENSGFLALQIGELSALMVATKIVAPNLWGWIADHTGKGMRIIRIASFFAALFFAGFLFFEGYLWFALITVCFSFFWNAALPQFEAATLFHLKHEAHRYSQIRLWGSVGFIVTVLGIGRLLEFFSIGNLPWVITLMLSLIWMVALLTPEAKAGISPHDTVGIWRILLRPEVIAFFLVYMLLQLAHGPYYVFYSIYLNQHAYPATLIGALWAVGVCAEIVLFIFMKRLLAKISLRIILLISIALSIARWLMIAHYPDSLLMMLAAQLLHAATFGSSHVAAIHLVHQYFGGRHQGKGQALYSSMSFGLGGMLGSLYSGYLWDSFGATFVYSMAAACCCLAFIIAFIWVGREKQALLS